jgi:hypothetical protein
VHIQPLAIPLEPCPYLTILVIRSVVLHQNRPTATVVSSNHLKKRSIRLRVEYGILLVIELGTIDLYGAKDLHALACSGHGDFGWAPDWAPRRVECGVLAETCFVGEDERTVFSLRFFLGLGRFSCANGLVLQRQRVPEHGAASGRRIRSGGGASVHGRDDTQLRTPPQ